MSNNRLRTFAFQLNTLNGSQPLVNTLKQIQIDSLPSRMRTIGYSDVRVEDIQNNGDIWFLDFIKFREVNGPGKGSKTTAVQGFVFAQGETFCEEAAMMVDLKTNRVAIQYNHHGVRHPLMEQYLSTYAGKGDLYSLNPTYEKSIDTMFSNRKSLMSLKVKVANHRLSDTDKANNVSLMAAVNSIDSSARFIDINISVGRKKKAELGSTSQLIASEALSLCQTNPDAVKKLEAKIIDSQTNQQAVLDLIEQRVHSSVGGLSIGKDKRWIRQQRYSALEQSLARWIKEGKI